MFPVTLEDTEGNVLTVHPPCYGFLQLRNYNGGVDEDDDEDEYFDPNMYEATHGWNMHVRVWHEEANVRSADGEEFQICLILHISISRLNRNSGTHMKMLGFRRWRDEKPVSADLGWGAIDHEGELKNNIEHWNDKNPEYQTFFVPA